MSEASKDLGFTFRTASDRSVRVFRDGREVTILRGSAAQRFLAKADGASVEAIQQLCARVTGNYKRGNESVAARIHDRKASSS